MMRSKTDRQKSPIRLCCLGCDGRSATMVLRQSQSRLKALSSITTDKRSQDVFVIRRLRRWIHGVIVPARDRCSSCHLSTPAPVVRLLLFESRTRLLICKISGRSVRIFAILDSEDRRKFAYKYNSDTPTACVRSSLSRIVWRCIYLAGVVCWWQRAKLWLVEELTMYYRNIDHEHNAYDFVGAVINS